MTLDCEQFETPLGTRALIFSKRYYGVLSKTLENIDVERYYSVLYYIQKQEGNCCQQSICNQLAIDKTAMVKILDSLTKAGFIERKTNPKDRREHVVVLSAKGKKQTKEIEKAFKNLDRELFNGISEKDKRVFLEVLSRSTENLTQLPANDLFFNYKKTKK